MNHYKHLIFCLLGLTLSAYAQKGQVSKLTTKSSYLQRNLTVSSDSNTVGLDLFIRIPLSDSLSKVLIKFLDQNGTALYSDSANITKNGKTFSSSFVRKGAVPIDNTGNMKMTISMPYQTYLRSVKHIVLLKDKEGYYSKEAYLREQY